MKVWYVATEDGALRFEAPTIEEARRRAFAWMEVETRVAALREAQAFFRSRGAS